MNNLPKRKSPRLNEYDYSQNGAYFITICTKDMKCVLSTIVGEGLRALPKTVLTPLGKEVENAILYINKTYSYTKVTSYVIMPNHVHMIITIEKPISDLSGGHGDPPLQNIIGYFKSFTSRSFNGTLWQRSFNDHIIRNEDDLCQHLQYIDENPKKWIMGKDEYYA